MSGVLDCDPAKNPDHPIDVRRSVVDDAEAAGGAMVSTGAVAAVRGHSFGHAVLAEVDAVAGAHHGGKLVRAVLCAFAPAVVWLALLGERRWTIHATARATEPGAHVTIRALELDPRERF